MLLVRIIVVVFIGGGSGSTIAIGIVNIVESSIADAATDTAASIGNATYIIIMFAPSSSHPRRSLVLERVPEERRFMIADRCHTNTL